MLVGLFTLTRSGQSVSFTVVQKAMLDARAHGWCSGVELLAERVEAQRRMVHQFEEALLDQIEVCFPAVLVRHGNEQDGLFDDDVHVILRWPFALDATRGLSVVVVEKGFRPAVEKEGERVLLVVDVDDVVRGLRVVREKCRGEGVDDLRAFLVEIDVR